MEVLIVSKTHMGGAACVGGMVLDNNAQVRLLQPGQFWNQPANTDYEVGQVWDIAFQPRRDTTPPHVEDVIVNSRHFLRDQGHLRDFLLARAKHWNGGPGCLFDGLLHPTMAGSGFVARSTGLPSESTGFWLSDFPLVRTDEPKTRYRYTGRSGIHLISYVGYQPAIEEIPANTLLRVSLARWWHPADNPDMEDRCYLQLSGWYT